MAVAQERTRRCRYSTNTREASKDIPHNLEFGQDEGFQSLHAQSTQALATSVPRPSRSLLKSPDKLPRKKSNRVRFADTLGITLTTVQWIEAVDRPRPVPSKSCAKRDESSKNVTSVATQTPTRRFQFPQPGRQPDFLSKLREKKVLLESIIAEGLAAYGTVRAVNRKHARDICVKWTTDHWKVITTTTCSYEKPCLDGTHKYTFTLPANVDKVEFSIRYRCAKRQYWDNNDGHNYITVVEG